MMLSIPVPIMLVSLTLIVACVVMPHILLYALIMKRDEDRISRTDLGDIDDFQYVPPEYLERMFYDPKAEIYFVPKFK